MTERQELILKGIVEGYVSSAQPVSSQILCENAAIAVSSATIRNEMAALEQQGFIQQPYTSAGRVPSVSGFQYYVQKLLRPKPLSKREEARFDAIFNASGVRGLARQSAELCRAAVVLAHSEKDLYFTGFAFLFSDPEFSRYDNIRAMSIAIDRVEGLLPSLMTTVDDAQPSVFMGSENPLGDACVAMFIRGAESRSALLGIITSLHTNYARNIGLLSSIRTYL